MCRQTEWYGHVSAIATPILSLVFGFFFFWVDLTYPEKKFVKKKIKMCMFEVIECRVENARILKSIKAQ